MTKEEYDGCQRQLAWFAKHQKGLYYEILTFFVGSHISYHRDGRIFRTSPATSCYPNRIRKYLPLEEFEGLYQLGLGMAWKSELMKNPCLKARARNKALALHEVDLEVYPSEIINIIVEFLEPNKKELIMSPDIAPPPDATMVVIDSIKPWILLTILGHEHNLLIKPREDGFVARHFNNRYSANLPGVEYKFEAYG